LAPAGVAGAKEQNFDFAHNHSIYICLGESIGAKKLPAARGRCFAVLAQPLGILGQRGHILKTARQALH
jgi:hypothetical protein